MDDLNIMILQEDRTFRPRQSNRHLHYPPNILLVRLDGTEERRLFSATASKHDRYDFS